MPLSQRKGPSGRHTALSTGATSQSRMRQSSPNRSSAMKWSSEVEELLLKTSAKNGRLTRQRTGSGRIAEASEVGVATSEPAILNVTCHNEGRAAMTEGGEFNYSDEDFADEESAGEESTKEDFADEGSAEEDFADEESAGEESAGEESAGEESAGEESADEGSAGEESADEGSADEDSVNENPDEMGRDSNTSAGLRHISHYESWQKKISGKTRGPFENSKSSQDTGSEPPFGCPASWYSPEPKLQDPILDLVDEDALALEEAAPPSLEAPATEQPALGKGKKRAAEYIDERSRKRLLPTALSEAIGRLATIKDAENRLREEDLKIWKEQQSIKPILEAWSLLSAEYGNDLDENEMTQAMLTLEDRTKASIFSFLHTRGEKRLVVAWLFASSKR